MKFSTFLLKGAIFSTLALSLYTLAMWKLSKGDVDYYYPKFTHQAGSLIIGSSRAWDGISPSIIEKELGNQNIAKPVLNFAFTVYISPYGEVYRNAIEKKIQPGTSNGLFLLEVSPGALTKFKAISPGREASIDQESLLGQLWAFNARPNLDYIRRHYGEALYKAWVPTIKPYDIRRIHPDGWMEVFSETENYVMSEEEKRQWLETQVQAYREELPNIQPSAYRLASLADTVRWLDARGSVFLFRAPISREYLALEESYWPSFSQDMEAFAATLGVEYLDYSQVGNRYSFYDGSHLLGESAKDFTHDLSHAVEGHL